MRQCVACREMKPKQELVRVVKNTQGEIAIDLKGKLPGRGAYLCTQEQCFKKVKKTKALDRVFKASVPIEVYETLEESLVVLSQEVSLS